MVQFEIIVPILLLLFFVGIWLLVLKILSIQSGWTTLAERFHYYDKFEGSYYRFQTARMNKVFFRSSLEIGMNVMGLYLIPMIFFRLFHTPLFIPWAEIEAEPGKSLLIKIYRLRFRSYPNITLEVFKKSFDRMVEFHGALKNLQPKISTL
jgi:hypothetical protein